MKASPWDGKIKDFKLEPASFSQMVHTVVPGAGAGAGGQARSPWRLDDRDPALPDFPSDDIHSHVLWWHCSALASDALLQYFLPRLKLTVFGTQPETWSEKTWENITRVFTREKKLVKQIIWIFIAARFYGRHFTCTTFQRSIPEYTFSFFLDALASLRPILESD